MDGFPQEAEFRYAWRSYQEAVLKELNSYLDDNNLNIVAAPGSGKTILGLEVMLRLGKATLILAPTIAIRDQWVSRFTELFLASPRPPDWMSLDVRKPGFLTISTYQALYMAFSGHDGDLDEHELLQQKEVLTVSLEKASPVIRGLRENMVQTLIIDEAHHLRNAWWKSLIHLKSRLDKVQVVALTATPPYDVSPAEWRNYQELCGPVDAEISVPELVRVGNLCPHQDFIYLNVPSVEEGAVLAEFRSGTRSFLEDLQSNAVLIKALQEHAVVRDPERHCEAIFSNTEYYSSILIFLNQVQAELPAPLLEMMGIKKRRLPPLSREWAELFLKNLIYRDALFKEHNKGLLRELRDRLKRTGAVESGNVFLGESPALSRLLRNSSNKLESVLEIVRLEHQAMGERLRMVILTDFIRKEYLAAGDAGEAGSVRIGVVPLFNAIRRRYPECGKLGILSGSLIVLPAGARPRLLREMADAAISGDSLALQELPAHPGYHSLRIKGNDAHQIVRLVTRLFNLGEIEILVGTASLLGEGWDAPTVNTLVLASAVGSFMLSNQMRGRAIRIDQENPQKVSNIWHLATVEPDSGDPGHDFELLERRFRAFTGISASGKKIVSGLERTGIIRTRYSAKAVARSNAETASRALARERTDRVWRDILEHGEIGQITPGLRSERSAVPRPFVLRKTILALLLNGLSWGTVYLEYTDRYLHSLFRNDRIVILMLIGFVAITTPFMLKAFRLFLRNGPVEGMVKSIGTVVLGTLCEFDFFRTDRDAIQVVAWKEEGDDGRKYTHCTIEGATAFEKSLFLSCLAQIFDPLGNPRYVLCRTAKKLFWLRNDYHAVPDLFSRKKAYAEYFAAAWKKEIGSAQLVYTRNHRGHRFLLKARQRALSTALQKRAERMDVWR